MDLLAQDLLPLRSSPLLGRRAVLRLATSAIIHQTASVRVRTRTRPRSGWLAFVLFGPRATGLVNGLQVRPGMMLVAGPNTEAGFVVNLGWESLTVLVPADNARQHLTALHPGSELKWLSGVQVLRVDPGRTRRLFNLGKRMVDNASRTSLVSGFARARCGACGHDFLIAFSCKGRGLFPSCTTRRMVETAAHLVEHVFPQVPVRQWVITFPRRLRYFVHRDPVLLGRVRRSVLRAIESGLRRRCPDAPHDSRFGAVSFVQRFGSALNAHTHLHCCVTDGVFSVDADDTLRFHPAVDLAETAISAVQRRIRSRVLRLAVRHGALTPDVAADLARWGHGGGFSLHAAVRIDAEDRAGLERLLRYCARPAFASERLAWDGSDQPVRYSLPKPLPTGQTELTLTPLELLDRLAALVPPPRRHRHHYAGVFAPHAALRARVTACAGQPVTETVSVTAPAPDPALPTASRRRASIHWARLLARIYEIRPLTCPRCHGEMRLIAFLTEPASIRTLLAHLGEPMTPPPLAPRARAPPELETDRVGTPQFAFDQSPSWDSITPPPDPGFSFDQTLD